MSVSVPVVIEDDNISYLWGRVFLRSLALPCSNPAPTMVSLKCPNAPHVDQDGNILAELSDVLRLLGKPTVRASAMVVFPYDSWVRQGRPPCKQFSHWCLTRLAPKLRARCKLNTRGMYFERMMSFEGRAGRCEEGIDQLSRIVEWWNERLQKCATRPPRSRLQVSCFDPHLDGKHQRPSFPCLQQVSFSYEGDALAVSGYYPLQYVVDRAYGNYLGLFHLGVFMAAQLGLRLARLNCFVGLAQRGGENVTVAATQHLQTQVVASLTAAGRQTDGS